MKKLLLILLVLGWQMAGAQWSVLKARQYPYASTVGYVPVSYDSSGFSILFHLKVSDLAGGGGGAATWGTITGTLSSQTDLQTALNGKQAALSGTGFVKISGTTISYDASTYLTANQSITISNDVAGSGATAISATVNGLKGVALPTLGATAGLLKYTGTGTNTWVFDNNTYLTGNQTISFAPTGDVTGSTTGTTTLAPALTIGSGTVTLAKMANLAANSIIGNNTGSAAVPLALTVSQVKTLLALDAVENTALSTWTGSTNFTTLANNAVSYAEMQDVSATQRIIGRNTAGAGDPEEVTASQVLDWFSATQGAILYRGASGWAALAPGTSGQLLQSGGAAANPSWANAGSGSGDMILAATQTVTGAKTFNAGTLLLAAGTSSAAPLDFATGTLVTASAQGNMEVDGNGILMYTPKSGGTAATAERGYMPATQLLTNSSVVTLTVQTAAQSVFASTMDAVQLSANTTYRFHAVYFGTQTSSTTAHAIRSAFSYSGTLGGTFKYLSIGNVSAIASNTSGQIVYVNTTAATNVTNSTASVTNFQIILDGELRTSTAGLLTPQIGMSVTTGITTFQIDTESYFEIWPVGSDTVTVVGTGQ